MLVIFHCLLHNRIEWLNENEQSTKQSIIDESINNELNKHYQNVNEDRLMIIIQPVELRASSTKMGGAGTRCKRATYIHYLPVTRTIKRETVTETRD